MKKQKKAFTLIEVITVVIIIVILRTISIVNYSESLPDVRDTQRKADIWNLKSSLKTYYQQRNTYPFPWDYFNLTNGSTWVVLQWKMNKNVVLPTLENIPTDPENTVNYLYSITKNKQDFQIAWTLENTDNPKAILEWSYKTVSKNILPSLIIAHNWVSGSSVDISDVNNRKKFILNSWKYNLAYDFEWTWLPYSDSSITDLNFLFNDSWIDFWQNSDYKNCTEIYEAWKSVWNGEYQILNETWILVNTWCTF